VVRPRATSRPADRGVGYPLADDGLQSFENGTAAGFARHDASFGTLVISLPKCCPP